MRTLVRFSLFTFALSFTAFAFAGDGPSTPSGGGTGRMRCAVYDTGWEEHGYHSSCQDCKSTHSQCEEKCYRYTYECSAKGLDEKGQSIEFKAIDNLEYQARDEALDRCYEARMTQCSVSSCTENSSLMSRRSCQ